MNPDLILAFDTASENIALALGRWKNQPQNAGLEIETLCSNDHPAVRQANVQLVPSIDALLKENSLDKARISCVVCGLGPGSFTGVRIGVATAKGIARGLRVPLYGVSTLDAVAWEAWAQGLRGRLGVVADAMRGEVYPARFELSASGVQRLDPHTVTKAVTIAAQWRAADKQLRAADEQWRVAGEQLLIIGDGLKKFANEFDGFVMGDATLWTPSGRGLLLAFEAACTDGVQGSGEAGTLLPVYTRLSDAEENERKRLAGGGQIAQGAIIEVPRSGVSDLSKLETIICRPMASSDLDQVAALEAAVFPEGALTSGERWTIEMFAEELACKDRTWWVAYSGDVLVGFAGALYIDGGLHVLDVCVAPTHRRRGIATKLVTNLIQDGINLGASSAMLEVRASNEQAQALYAAMGFVQTGTRPHYYAPNDPSEGSEREHAIIMEKALVDQGLPLIPSPALQTPLKPSSPLMNQRPPDLSSPSMRAQRSNPEDHVAALRLDCHVAPCASRNDNRNRNLSHAHPTPVILAIETSCDETAVAIINGEGTLLSDTIASQVDFHARFGGVVPEIASRKHTEAIVGVVDAALDKAGLTSWHDLDAVAVTYAPGLIGALVVGVAFAKGLSWATGLPLIRVNHLEGHIYANLFADKPKPIQPPFVIALLSGGNTMLVHARDWGNYRIMGQTLDDAVGEAFDKVAKVLGLGYPGGPVISRLAEQGNHKAIDFPRALLHSHDYSFSLSGLKTAVISYIKAEQSAGRALNLPDIAASFQQAVIDVQVAKALDALKETGCKTFCIGGGVAANRALRNAYMESMSKQGMHVVLPPGKACTDNAAMIALVALDRYRKSRFMSLADDAFAQADLEKLY